MKKYILLFASGITLLACAPQATEIIEDTNSSMETSAEVAGGMKIYAKKCSTCHDLKEIKKFSEDQWANILPGMAAKAELSAEEHAQVKAYVAWELAK